MVNFVNKDTWVSSISNEIVHSLVVSVKGHDKGTVYLVLSKEASDVKKSDFLYLADGKLKKVSSPKKKKRKHVRPYLQNNESFREYFLSYFPTGTPVTDGRLRRLIRNFVNQSVSPQSREEE